MQVVLLSGGSGKRLWPLSNSARSKQFLKLLPALDGGAESMLQRVARQIRESGMECSITVATSVAQRDGVTNQLGPDVPVVTEPERRETFPAIALAAAYLAYEKHCPADETVVVMPCDPYTEAGYFETIKRMVKAVEESVAELVLMGIKPTSPSTRYGYILPRKDAERDGLYGVRRFEEKPDTENAGRLIEQGALWNSGVFAFRLGYMTAIARRYVGATAFEEVRAHYAEFPKTSFDCEVVEKARSAVVVPFEGQWKDLGNWNALAGELHDRCVGNVIMASCENTHVLNELELPIMCIGLDNLVIAASRDGIIVSDKMRSDYIEKYTDRLQLRPMFEERRWGEYKVIDTIEFPDGFKTLTKHLMVRAGKNISYQLHRHRSEVWTFIDGEGLLVLDGKVTKIRRGDTIDIKQGVKHAVKALKDLRFIEVQSGDMLVEEDIERFDWTW